MLGQRYIFNCLEVGRVGGGGHLLASFKYQQLKPCNSFKVNFVGSNKLQWFDESLDSRESMLLEEIYK
jgi:hypothetical protein